MILSPILHTPFLFNWLLQMLYRNLLVFWNNSYLSSVLNASKRVKKILRKSHPPSVSFRVLLMFSCYRFNDSGVMLKYLMYLELIVVYWPMDIQDLPYNFLNTMCLFGSLSGSYSEISLCSGLLFSSIGLWFCFCVNTILVLSLEACNKPYSLKW